MVVPGKDCSKNATAKEVAAATVTLLKRTTPSAVPGVMFLSGGLSENNATEYLKEMNALGVSLPWSLSFSYGRALQDSVLSTWKGKKENVDEAQKAYLKRAKENYLAALPQPSKAKI